MATHKQTRVLRRLHSERAAQSHCYGRAIRIVGGSMVVDTTSRAWARREKHITNEAALVAILNADVGTVPS